MQVSAVEESEPKLGDIVTDDVEIYLMSPKTRGVVDVAVEKVGIYVGDTWFNLFWNAYNTGTWEKWNGSWATTYISYYKFKSGAIGYCIEPNNFNSGIGSERQPISFDDITTPWSSIGYKFEHEKQEGISLVMAYGAPNNGDRTDSGYYATSLLIWDMACGYRKPNGSLRFSSYSSPFYAQMKSAVASSNPTLWNEVDAKYNEILGYLATHGTIPSFSAPLRSQVGDANTITLTYDSSSGLYKGSVTDSNKVLKNFNYVSTVDGLTFTKDGNTLNISATAAAASKFSSGLTIAARGNEVEVGPDSVIVWGNSNDDQPMATLSAETDPVPSYFKLRANMTGNISGTKTTDTGTDLSGWQFQLKSGSSVVATATSDNNGKFSFTGVAPGTYTITEVIPSNSKYECTNNNQSVTVTSGGTATVSFHNKQKVGKITFTKQTNTGANLSGWEIKLYSDSALKNLVGTYKTGSDGKVTTGNLTPGTYYAKETASSNTYWGSDTEVKTITVSAGNTVSATFKNTHYGKISFTKKTNTGNDLNSWEIKLYSDSELKNLIGTYITGSSGNATTENLLPGTYYAKESKSTDSYWGSDSEVKTITVKAGETSTCTFTNTHYGKLKVIKTLDTDGKLDGWQFKVTRLSDNADMGTLTSQSDGTVLSENLLPGNYLIEEIIPDDSLYYSKTENPLTVTIQAGKTTEARFINALRPGQILIEKVNFKDEHLAGAKFMLEWSEDGKTWSKVTFSDKADVIKGGCTTDGLIDGTLVTDDTGIIIFEGLYPGLEYRVTEIEAPNGYVKLADYAFEGQLPVDDLKVDLEVVNSTGYQLPDTGIEDSGSYITLGSTMVFTTLIMILLLVGYYVFTSKKAVK